MMIIMTVVIIIIIHVIIVIDIIFPGATMMRAWSFARQLSLHLFFGYNSNIIRSR